MAEWESVGIFKVTSERGGHEFYAANSFAEAEEMAQHEISNVRKIELHVVAKRPTQGKEG